MRTFLSSCRYVLACLFLAWPYVHLVQAGSLSRIQYTSLCKPPSAIKPADPFATRGGFSESTDTRLPLGTFRSRANFLLWNIPLLVAVVSFMTFRPMVRLLNMFVDWASPNSWLPSTEDQINLQTNVITQVVNGPVITSISVLFASLISTTISRLHSRQIIIQRSLTWEVHQLRVLQALLASPAGKLGLTDEQRMRVLALVQQYNENLFSTRYSSTLERSDPHLYIESTLPELLHWCHEVVSAYRSHMATNNRWRHQSVSPEPLVSEIQALAHGMLEERGNRWMAFLAVPFPFVHYATVTFLAVAICVSFLVATAQARVTFRDDGILSVRILWSVLMTAFSALGVLCYDLSSPFLGAYLVADRAGSREVPAF